MSTENLAQRDPAYLQSMREHMAFEKIHSAVTDYDTFMVAAMEEFTEVVNTCLGLQPGAEGLQLANESLKDNELVNSLSAEGIVENVKNAWQSLTQKEASFMERISGSIQGALNTAGNGLVAMNAAQREFHKNPPKWEGTKLVRTSLATTLEGGATTNRFPQVLRASLDSASNVYDTIIRFQPVLSSHDTFAFGKEKQNKMLEKNRKDFLAFFDALKTAGALHVKQTSEQMVQLSNARLSGNFVFHMTEPTQEISDFGAGNFLKARRIIGRFSFKVTRETTTSSDVQLTVNDARALAQELGNYQNYVERNLERMKHARFGVLVDNIDLSAVIGMTGATLVTGNGLGAIGGLLYQFIRDFNRLAAMRRRAVWTYAETAVGMIRYNNFVFREGARMMSQFQK